MSAACITETIHYSEGIVTRRSETHYAISLPNPESVHHEFRIIGVLWQVWQSDRNRYFDETMQWTISTSELNELTIPLRTIMMVIDLELRQTGRELLIVDARTAP